MRASPPGGQGAAPSKFSARSRREVELEKTQPETAQIPMPMPSRLIHLAEHRAECDHRESQRAPEGPDALRREEAEVAGA